MYLKVVQVVLVVAFFKTKVNGKETHKMYTYISRYYVAVSP